MVLVEKWPFFQIFFLGNIDQENVFNDILERKNAFQGYKKGVVHVFFFCKNWPYFNFFLF